MINTAIISNDEKIHQLLTDQEDINVTIITARGLDETVQQLSQCAPDIIVIEQTLDNMDVDILCHFLRKACPDAQHIILASELATFETLQNAGFHIRAYISPEQRPMIVKAVHVVHKGEAWLPRKLVTEMLNHFASIHAEIAGNAQPKLRVIR